MTLRLSCASALTLTARPPSCVETGGDFFATLSFTASPRRDWREQVEAVFSSLQEVTATFTTPKFVFAREQADADIFALYQLSYSTLRVPA